MTDALSDQPGLWQERVLLNEEFYRALRDHPVPLSESALRAIGPRSMVIDVYIWLAYRLHAMKRDVEIGWPALHAQLGRATPAFGRSAHSSSRRSTWPAPFTPRLTSLLATAASFCALPAPLSPRPERHQTPRLRRQRTPQEMPEFLANCALGASCPDQSEPIMWSLVAAYGGG
jgi:hypothetical protein